MCTLCSLHHFRARCFSPGVDVSRELSTVSALSHGSFGATWCAFFANVKIAEPEVWGSEDYPSTRSPPAHRSICSARCGFFGCLVAWLFGCLVACWLVGLYGLLVWFGLVCFGFGFKPLHHDTVARPRRGVVVCCLLFVVGCWCVVVVCCVCVVVVCCSLFRCFAVSLFRSTLTCVTWQQSWRPTRRIQCGSDKPCWTPFSHPGCGQALCLLTGSDEQWPSLSHGLRTRAAHSALSKTFVEGKRRASYRMLSHPGHLKKVDHSSRLFLLRARLRPARARVAPGWAVISLAIVRTTFESFLHVLHPVSSLSGVS